MWHLKTSSEVERQKWITTLELARAGKPNLDGGSGQDNTDSDSDDDESQGPDLKQLQAKLVDLQTCHDLIKKHQTSLQRVINDLGEHKVHVSLTDLVSLVQTMMCHAHCRKSQPCS